MVRAAVGETGVGNCFGFACRMMSRMSVFMLNCDCLASQLREYSHHCSKHDFETESMQKSKLFILGLACKDQSRRHSRVQRGHEASAMSQCMVTATVTTGQR